MDLHQVQNRFAEMLEAGVFDDDELLVGLCRYCNCTDHGPCLVPATARTLGAIEIEPDVYVVPCGWHRAPGADGFGVCSSPDCVQAYLADRTAP